MPKNKPEHSIRPEDSVLKKASYFFASLFGIGFIPFAPGTMASIATLPVVWFLVFAGGMVSGVRVLLIGTLVVTVLGYMAAFVALKYAKPDPDPKFIVVDEAAGQMATFILPVLFFGSHVSSFVIYLGGFILFRFFDIVKPFHIGWIDKHVGGALGVMLDDILAAVYATAVLCIFLALFYFIMSVNSTPPPVVG